MGIKQTLQKFGKRTETAEDHFDSTLQTHYYKAMRDSVVKELEAMFGQREGFHIVSFSQEHGEMIVNIKKGKKAFMVVTVIMVRPYRTAVDFSVNTETFFFSDFGYSAALVRQMYKELNGRLTFVGTALGNELSR